MTRDDTPPYGTPSPVAPTMFGDACSVPAPDVHEAPTLRCATVRDWRDVSRELESYVVAMFDVARSLPPAPVIRLLAEMRSLRGDA